MLVLCLVPVSLKAQVQPDDYQTRFAALSRAYAKNPRSVEALYNLTQFYFDNAHPMRNLPLAMQFATMTEEWHTYLLQNDKVNELIRLQRNNITLPVIRELRQAIADAALNTVRLRTDMDEAELDAYAATFGDDAELMKLVRQRRFVLLYDNTVASGTADQCYDFITTYPGIAESERVEARLIQLTAPLIEDMESAAAVDSMAARYAQSAAVRRAAERRKAQLAFTDAAVGGTIADYSRFLARYPASDESEQARERIDRLQQIDLARRTTAKELAQFADSNADQDIADQALARLRRLIYTTHDATAAQYYVDHFKLDAYRSEVYSHYYAWHSVEGNAAPLERFAAANPDFPFLRALESDLERAAEIDTVPLLEDYIETAYDRYADYIRHMMGKAIAVVPLQRMLQPLLRDRRYADALYRVEQFEICFDNQWQSQYDELRRLLATATAARTLRLELADSGQVLHPAVNPADGCLYFSDGNLVRRATGKGGRWHPTDTVRIDGAGESPLSFFGFNADGSRMVLGQGGDIWFAERDGDGWRMSDLLPWPVNTDYVETDAYLLPDGSGMLLASDRPGGLNLQPSGANFHGDTALATDLWFIPYASHRWGTPVNLGIKVNTAYSERWPLLSRNLKTLYFVSDGHVGLGYGDIYMVERTDIEDWTSWLEPQNLGREVNSPFREGGISFAPDERRLYLSTNAGGTYEAYSFATSHSNANTAGTYVLDVSDLGRSLVRVQVADVAQQTTTQVVDFGGGESSVSLNLHSDRRYALLADAGTQFVTAGIVSPREMGSYRLPAYTYEELVAMDRPLPLPVVDFSADGDVLLPVAQLQLAQLARFVGAHPQAVIEFVVDVAGSDARQCYDLSLLRCDALRDFMTGHGIAAGRIMLSAWGNARVGMGGADAVGVRFRE